MTLPITFDPAATADVIDAVHWYEGQRAGLGAKFYTEISRLAALAAKNPAHYACILRDIRRVSSRRFPYSLYFRVAPAIMVVLAVLHMRRSPSRLMP